jgi:hypothetical protein
MAIPFRALHPADGVGVRGRAQFAAGNAAEVVGDDVVVADAAGFAPVFVMDAIEKLDQLERLDEEAGFFAHLARDAFDEGFTDFEHAAGQRPMAFEGFAAAAHEEHTVLVDYDRAHADERRLGKLALHFVQSGSLRG